MGYSISISTLFNLPATGSTSNPIDSRAVTPMTAGSSSSPNITPAAPENAVVVHGYSSNFACNDAAQPAELLLAYPANAQALQQACGQYAQSCPCVHQCPDTLAYFRGRRVGYPDVDVNEPHPNLLSLPPGSDAAASPPSRPCWLKRAALHVHDAPVGTAPRLPHLENLALAVNRVAMEDRRVVGDLLVLQVGDRLARSVPARSSRRAG